MRWYMHMHNTYIWYARVRSTVYILFIRNLCVMNIQVLILVFVHLLGDEMSIIVLIYVVDVVDDVVVDARHCQCRCWLFRLSNLNG